jgi:hypothetical protein
LSIHRFEKVATPDEAVTVVVPDKVPNPGFVPIAMVMLAADEVTVLPKLSCTVTCTAGEIATPAVVFDGCTENASFDAEAGEMSNAVLVAPVNPVEVAVKVYPVPDLSIDRPEKVATPFTAVTVSAPDNVPPPGFVPIEMVMLAADEVTVLLKLSCTVTCTAGVNGLPAPVFDGWTVNATFAAPAAVMLNVVLVAPVSPVEAAVSV